MTISIAGIVIFGLLWYNEVTVARPMDFVIDVIILPVWSMSFVA